MYELTILTCKRLQENIVELSFWYFSRLMNDLSWNHWELALALCLFSNLALFFSTIRKNANDQIDECSPIPETGNSGSRAKFSQKKPPFVNAKDTICSGSNIFTRRLPSFYGCILKISIYYLSLIYCAYFLWIYNGKYTIF